MISFDLLSVRGLAAVCAGLWESTRDSPTMEHAASSVVRTLRELFVDDDRSDIVLARIFQTANTAGLPDEIRAQLTPAPDGTIPERCMLLLGTEGDLPEWCDRRRSQGHQAIGLTSPEALAAMPMVSALVENLNVDVDLFLRGDASHTAAELEVFFVPEAAGSSSVPAQDFVEEHGVASVLGFGDILPDGELFAVILFTRSRVSEDVAPSFRQVAVAAKLALLEAIRAPLLDGMPPRSIDYESVAESRIRGLEQMVVTQQHAVDFQTVRLEATLADAIEARRLAEREVETVEALREISQALSANLDIDDLVQQATDVATSITGAAFGAFFYNVVRDSGSFMLYTLSGAPAEAFSKFPQPRATEVFAPTFHAESVVRSDDITLDARYGQMSPYHGLPEGHLPVRSYLAVPVVSPTGEAIGGLFFGHPETGVFDERAERLAVGIAAQVAVTLDNARLYQSERRTALVLQQSLLPETIAAPPGLSIGYEYLAGGGGLDVGGDWFDVIPLPGGRTALVIGDVMGRGIRAAAIMGQLRTAVRAYAVTDLPPDLLLNRMNRIILDMDDNLIATCTYAILDPVRATLTLSSAGHMPPAFINPRGEVSIMDRPLGPPLGVPDGIHEELEIDFPAGSKVLLFTDGLVEHRGRPVSEGLDQLRLQLEEGIPDDDCALLVKQMLSETDQDDDVSLLLVGFDGLERSELASATFPANPEEASRARQFVTATLETWGDGPAVDAVVMAVNELVINVVSHAKSSVTLRLRRLPRTIVAEVEDNDSHLPRRMAASLFDEGHRGLTIVSVLSARWGTRVVHGGKVVWAEFDLPARR